MSGITVERIDSVTMYLILAVGAVVLTVGFIVVALLVGRKRKPRPHPVSRHSAARPIDAWRTEVSEIVASYHRDEIDEGEAYERLARVSRSFASQRTGTDFTAMTLMDLNMQPRVGSKASFDTFRQTIAALYPAQFAGPMNASARETTVDSAADWVDAMMERWVS